MLNTPLTKLRKAAPGSITGEKLAEKFKAKRYPRSEAQIGRFERGELLNPEPRFLELYAQLVGASLEAVRRAHSQAVREEKSRSEAQPLEAPQTAP